MTPQEYLEFTRTTMVNTLAGEDKATYMRLGLISEVGEVAGQVKRIIRDDGGVLTDERREKLLDELGDVLWYWAQMHDVSGRSLIDVWKGFPGWSGWDTSAVMSLILVAERSAAGRDWACVEVMAGATATMLGSTLEEVAVRNVAKLSGRVAAGTIHGEGDDR